MYRAVLERLWSSSAVGGGVLLLEKRGRLLDIH